MTWRNLLLLAAILAFLALSFCVDRPPADLTSPSTSHQGART